MLLVCTFCILVFLTVSLQIWWIGGQGNSKSVKDWKWVDSYGSASGADIRQQWGNFTDYTVTKEMVPGNMWILSMNFKIFSSSFPTPYCGYICELKTPSPNIGTALRSLIFTVPNLKSGITFFTAQNFSEEWNGRKVEKLGCKGSSCFWIIGASSPSTTGKQWMIDYRDAWTECTDVLGGARLAHLGTMGLYSWFKKQLSLKRTGQFQWISECIFQVMWLSEFEL